ncbi:MAG: hypothetical protein KC561_16550 [Myxococcales bacterium]|nr:hypothetical protein [Myxococcales bacterium]
MLSSPSAGTAQDGADTSPPPGALADIESHRDRFMELCAEAGVPLPFVPTIAEWTRPSLISWRARERMVAVPVWDELAPPQHALFEEMAAGIGGQTLFDWLFRWFFVPHELGHALQSSVCPDRFGHYHSEQQANDIAVAFWMIARPEALDVLEQIIATVAAGVPNPVPEGEQPAAFFDTNYDTLASDPWAYGYFQFRFVSSSLERRHDLVLREVLEQLCDDEAVPAR